VSTLVAIRATDRSNRQTDLLPTSPAQNVAMRRASKLPWRRNLAGSRPGSPRASLRPASQATCPGAKIRPPWKTPRVGVRNEMDAPVATEDELRCLSEESAPFLQMKTDLSDRGARAALSAGKVRAGRLGGADSVGLDDAARGQPQRLLGLAAQAEGDAPTRPGVRSRVLAQRGEVLSFPLSRRLRASARPSPRLHRQRCRS
jgi:hypothetical protein